MTGQTVILSNFQKRDIEALIHPYTNLHSLPENGSKIFEKGRGIRIFDSEGRDYIDGLAGLWCTALGYSNAELIEAARIQMERLSFYHLFGGKSHEPAIALAEKLKELAPTNISKVLFANSGSEANDTQIKLVWYMNNALGRPKKKKIISRHRAYHGVTIASASLTGLVNNHRDFDLPISRILHTSCPYYYRMARPDETEEQFVDRLALELEDLIIEENPETIAAFIAEPVMGAGGVIVPPKGYFERIQSVLDRYDIFFIDDEVICGFGRLGAMFGSQVLGMKPHSITLAKALTSAYIPMSAILIPDKMHDAMVEESRKIGSFGHGFTYSGHPVAAAVALKTLEIFERDNLLDRVQNLIPHFWGRLEGLKCHPLVGDIRGCGLLAGIELVENPETRQPFGESVGFGAIAAKAIESQGVVTRAIGDVIALCPPLIIERTEIDELIDKVERGLNQTLDLALMRQI